MQAELLLDRPRGWVVVRVAGEVDIATAADLDDALDRALATRSSVVVCDVSRVTFFAVAGLHSLERAGRHLRAAGVDPRLVVGQAAASLPVLALMVAVCGWPVHDTVETAVSAALSAEAVRHARESG